MLCSETFCNFFFEFQIIFEFVFELVVQNVFKMVGISCQSQIRGRFVLVRLVEIQYSLFFAVDISEFKNDILRLRKFFQPVQEKCVGGRKYLNLAYTIKKNPVPKLSVGGSKRLTSKFQPVDTECVGG